MLNLKLHLRILSLAAVTLSALSSANAGTFTVNDTSDTMHGMCLSPCSLRDAIIESNGTTGPNTINFAIAGSGIQTIHPTSVLPAITQPVTLDGTTQDTNSSTPVIEISGDLTANGSALIFTTAATGSTIKGLIINRFVGAGLEISGPTNLTIQFNWIGLDSTGTAAAGNQSGGILLSGANGNQIGGSGASQRNVISGNGTGGIVLADSGSSSNVITGNYIGTNVAGTGAVPNTLGIYVASNLNIIGMNGSGNVIAFNTGAGILVDSGQGNFISGNSVFSNGELGIDLLPTSGAAHGVTANDSDDSDSGANGLQNFPVFSASVPTAGQLQIVGTLQSFPSTPFTLEYFANTSADGSGNGEGEVFLGAASGNMTDSNGTLMFNSTLNHTVANGETITMTAIDESSNDTSEFSASVAPIVPTATPTPQSTPQPQTFKQGGKIIDPPSTVVTGRTVTITLARFSIPKKKSLDASFAEARGSNGSIQYEVSLFKGKNLVKMQVAKRNTLTFKNLAPGNYSVRYVADLIQKKQIVGKTKKSPAARFTVS